MKTEPPFDSMLECEEWHKEKANQPDAVAEEQEEERLHALEFAAHCKAVKRDQQERFARRSLVNYVYRGRR